MPKDASYRLTWSFTDQTYQVLETRDRTRLLVVPDSPAWFSWLDQVTSFAFRGKGGHYTARKESRPRGEAYWYAYLGVGKKLSKKYLGRTTDVTLARLEQVAVALTSQEPAPRGDPPSGTTTLLFIDIEGSTRLLQRLGKGYAAVLTACRQLLRAAFEQHQGHEVDTQGDAFFVVFARASDAVAAAVAAQRALTDHARPAGVAIRVRMGLHTGEPLRLSEGYTGLDTHLAARIMSAAHGGQVLLSQTTRELVEHALPEGVSLRNLGEYRLKDLPHSTHLFQLVIEGFDADFPPLKTVELNKRGDPLLATKLHQPRPRSRLVSRSHLVARLQRSMEHVLTLVSAPAGFGKTTLLSQWLAESGTPAAWLSLEPEDNDPVRFLTYVIAALQTIDAQVGTAALELLRTPQPLSPETVVTLLTNDLLHSTVGDFALVLDDYHVITAEPLHRALTALVEHLPPQLHLILATRADPPLPLSRLRARGLLTEVRAADLRFSSEEASAFLRTSMGLDLSAGDSAALERRTEGWIAGLQLAALSLQGRADVSAFLASFTGSHRFVLDYLSEEVLTRQPAVVQSFLLHTSVLSRLSAPLCDAVTGKPGSQGMLEALERANLFVVALDDERGWYRYHHLFAEVLRSRLMQLQPSMVPELHGRASRWYEQHELFDEAVTHALAVPDVERAAQLIEQYAQLTNFPSQFQILLGWLDRLPDALVRAHPSLCMMHAITLMLTHQLEKCLDRLQDVERCLEMEMPAEQRRIILAQLAAFRSQLTRLVGDYERCIPLAQQALELFPETKEMSLTLMLHATALGTAANAYLVDGDMTPETERVVETTLASVRAKGNLPTTLRSISNLARLQLLQGRLRSAAATIEQAARLAAEYGGPQGLINGADYYFILGDLLCEWNQLDSAEQQLVQGMSLVKETATADAEMVTRGYLALARLQQARGQSAQVRETLNAFALVSRQRGYAPALLAHGIALQAQVDLAQGNLAAALRWTEASIVSISEELRYPSEREYLTLARVRIAQGREQPTGPFLSEALMLLERLLADAEAKMRMRSVLEVHLLRALALQAQGDHIGAMTALGRALALAEPEGYIRIFIDESVPMISLLRQAQKHKVAPGYVMTLLEAAGEPRGTESDLPSLRSSSLLEPLTEREREVLRLLVKGLSNSAIAQELIITVGTVKRHVNSIYGKLAVNSRTEAAARAHALHLL